MKKTLLILLLSFGLSSCVNHSLTNYPMGDGRFNISARGNSFLDQEDIKKEWYKEASKLCPKGYSIEKIEEKRKRLNGYPKPGLEGVINCK